MALVDASQALSALVPRRRLERPCRQCFSRSLKDFHLAFTYLHTETCFNPGIGRGAPLEVGSSRSEAVPFLELGNEAIRRHKLLKLSGFGIRIDRVPSAIRFNREKTKICVGKKSSVMGQFSADSLVLEYGDAMRRCAANSDIIFGVFGGAVQIFCGFALALRGASARNAYHCP
jgi:hypothetical protein